MAPSLANDPLTQATNAVGDALIGECIPAAQRVMEQRVGEACERCLARIDAALKTGVVGRWVQGGKLLPSQQRRLIAVINGSRFLGRGLDLQVAALREEIRSALRDVAEQTFEFVMLATAQAWNDNTPDGWEITATATEAERARARSLLISGEMIAAHVNRLLSDLARKVRAAVSVQITRQPSLAAALITTREQISSLWGGVEGRALQLVRAAALAADVLARDAVSRAATEVVALNREAA